MAPAPNFGVFLDLAYPFLTEVDFSIHDILDEFDFLIADFHHPTQFAVIGWLNIDMNLQSLNEYYDEYCSQREMIRSKINRNIITFI